MHVTSPEIGVSRVIPHPQTSTSPSTPNSPSSPLRHGCYNQGNQRQDPLQQGDGLCLLHPYVPSTSSSFPRFPRSASGNHLYLAEASKKKQRRRHLGLQIWSNGLISGWIMLVEWIANNRTPQTSGGPSPTSAFPLPL